MHRQIDLLYNIFFKCNFSSPRN